MKKYTIILKDRKGNTSEIGKVIFDSYNFPFEDNVIKVFKFNSIYLDIYIRPTITLKMN